MSNSQWSNEQPPAWQGPTPSTPNSDLPEPDAGWQPLPLKVLLGMTWGLFASNVKLFLLKNFAVVALGAIATLVSLRLFPIAMSDLTTALLAGDSKPLEDLLDATPKIKDQTKLIVDTVMPIIQMYAQTIPLMTVTSIIASGIAVQIGLNKTSDTEKVRISWVKLVTATLMSFIFLLVGISPIFILSLVSPNIATIAVLAAIPYLIWVGLGLAIVYPIVVNEKIGGIKSVKRSLQISRGNRSTIFLVGLIVAILAGLPGAAANQFMLLIPSTVLNFVEVTSLGSFVGMIISVPITTSATVILYRYLRGKFHN
ncbi:MAG: hypothetical protein RLZZ330_254 [Actinomycetota bacterium]|jgi:hypothetical protein